MRNILTIMLHDFRRLTASVVGIITLLGLVIVPCMFAWLNILSNWDPFEAESTANLPIAVAVEDQGSDLMDMKINVGEKVSDSLAANDSVKWIFVNNKDAAVKGVRSGKYYAAVVFPEDFSKDTLSITSGELEHPTLQYYVNEKKNAVSPKITAKVKAALQQEVDAAFIQTLAKYVTGATQLANSAGLDPRAVFSDLGRRLEILGADLETSAIMIEAASSLVDASNSLLDSSEKLIDSSQTTLKLGDKYLKSTRKRIPGSVDTSSVTTAVDQETSLLLTDLDNLSRDLTAARDNMAAYNGFVEKDLPAWKKLVKDMKDTVDAVITQLTKLGLTDLADRFKKISKELGDIYDKLDKLQKIDADTWSKTQEYIDQILKDISSSSNTLTSIRDDLDANLDSSLNKAVRDARKSISTTRQSLSGTYSDLGTLNKVLGDSEKSLSSLNGDLKETSVLLLSLQNGSLALSRMFTELAGSAALDDINSLMNDETDIVAENLASPIKMDTKTFYPVKNYGSAMAPFYTTISNWICALLSAIFISVQIKRKDELGNLPATQRFYGRYRLFMSIGLLQAILVALGDLVYVGIQCEHPFLFILSAMLNSVAFTLIVYSLVFALDSVGLGAVVVLLVTQVAGGGGSFPIQVLPTPFRILSNIMPMHYGYEAMRECIGGMYGLNYWKNLAIMMLIALVFVPFSLLIHKPMRKIIEKVKESEEASDIME